MKVTALFPTGVGRYEPEFTHFDEYGIAHYVVKMHEVPLDIHCDFIPPMTAIDLQIVPG